MYHSAATVSTLLLRLGEETRKFHDKNESEQNSLIITEENAEKTIEDDYEIINKEKLESKIDEDLASLENKLPKDKSQWSIKYEQLLASLLTDNLLTQYFDKKYDLNMKLIEYKSQHA